MPPEGQAEVAARVVAPPLFDRVVLQISVVLFLLFGAAVALLWRLGIFDAHTRASNAQIIAAALGLVGVLVTASLTFVGVLLKYSIDTRTAQQALDAQRRTEKQAEQEQLRQQLETSIRAVELLTEDGKPAGPTRQAGALFVLVNQDQLEFADALLGQIWADGAITPGAASWVVNQLLLKGDTALQRQAADLLNSHAETLASVPTGYEFPECMDLAWNIDVAPAAREALVEALMKILLAKKFPAWNPDDLNGVAVQFQIIGRTEDQSHIRNSAYLCLEALVEQILAPGDVTPDTHLFAPDGLISFAELRDEATRATTDVGDNVLSNVTTFVELMRTEWGTPSRSEEETHVEQAVGET